MALVNQASKYPTRKIMAVIISGMILGAAQSLLRLFWPEHPFAPYMDDIDIWLQGVVMIAAGYLTKEKTDEPDNKVNKLPQANVGNHDQLSFDLVRNDEETRGKVGNGKQASQGKGGAS
jgi:hypothetical protein